MNTRYEVQTRTEFDGWVNCWHENDQLLTFATESAAQWAIDELFECLAGAEMDDYRRDDYRIREVPPMATIDDRDSYSAPIDRAARARLQALTTAKADRMAIFFNHRLDSIELHSLANELEQLAEQYREVADGAVRHCRSGRLTKE